MHLVEQRGGEFGTGASQRMTKRDGATIHVQPVGIDRQLAQAGEHLRGKRLVQFDEIDLIQGQPGHLECLADRGYRPDAEPLGLDARRGVGDEPRERLQSACLGERGRRQQQRRGAVARLRRVAGGHAARDMKRRPQRRQGLRRRIASRSFVY